MADKSSNGGSMSELALELRKSITELAGPRGWAENRKSWLARAARKAGISYRTARSCFYLERADPKASVVERVRLALRRAQRDRVEEARAEFRDLIGRIARLEEALRQTDADFFSAERDALRALARGTGSPLDQE